MSDTGGVFVVSLEPVFGFIIEEGESVLDPALAAALSKPESLFESLLLDVEDAVEAVVSFPVEDSAPALLEVLLIQSSVKPFFTVTVRFNRNAKSH